MKTVVILDAATLGSELVIRAPNFEHQWLSYDNTKPDQIIERACEAHFIITNKVALDKQTLLQLPKLKHIAVAATGTNCVDVQTATELGISVSNVPGYGTTSVAEHVLGMILALRRGFLPYQNDIEAGKWQQSKQFCFYTQSILDISGAKLGIIGTGAIALEVAKLAEAFKMQVSFHSISGRKEFAGNSLLGLNELLSQSDVVSIHCPLTESANKLINTHTIKNMKKGSILINTARGSIVDLKALHTALIKGHLAGAGIDVAPEEPPQDNANILRLNALSNCIVTPHTAWASQQAREGLIESVIQNVEGAHRNLPRNLVSA